MGHFLKSTALLDSKANNSFFEFNFANINNHLTFSVCARNAATILNKCTNSMKVRGVNILKGSVW